MDWITVWLTNLLYRLIGHGTGWLAVFNDWQLKKASANYEYCGKMVLCLNDNKRVSTPGYLANPTLLIILN